MTAPDLGITDEAVEVAAAEFAFSINEMDRASLYRLHVENALAAAVPLLRKAWEQEECERPECRQIAQTASEVYCDLTGGKLSYPTYEARTIISEAEAYTQKLIDEELAAQRERIAGEIEAERASIVGNNAESLNQRAGLHVAAAIARGTSEASR